jgi:hypothetical protein
MTSTSDGVQPFLKHVGFVISCDKLNTSSYKNFDVDIFNSELIQVAFPDIENIETSEQVNNAYMQYQDSFIHILNKHALVKTRRPRKNPLPCKCLGMRLGLILS